MQGLKSKVAAEQAAQGALEDNDGARQKLRKAVAARDAAYRRATWTHVVCVHGGAAALAFVFVLRGLDDPS